MFDTKKKRLAVAGAVAATAITATVVPIGMAVAGHTNTVLETDLNGRNEVSTTTNRIVGDPNGRGEAYVFAIDGDPTTLCYVLTVDKIATATGAHIHRGPAGSNGPIVVNLAPPADGNAADCLTQGEILPNGNPAFAAGQTVAEILANPDNFYVNVHNAEYPTGAIRGQLQAER
ncbi:MAG: CHRD domain-containing protein [Nocardioides sp.]